MHDRRVPDDTPEALDKQWLNARAPVEVAGIIFYLVGPLRIDRSQVDRILDDVAYQGLLIEPPATAYAERAADSARCQQPIDR